MKLEKRIAAFVALGDKIKSLDEEEFDRLAARVESKNNWFTPIHIRQALEGIASFLDRETLNNWLRNYNIKDEPEAKSIGLILAGNIPAVGFHDIMCVLLTGHKLHAKLSSSDQVLLPWLMDELSAIEPGLDPYISFEENLAGKDAYIATGSDNSARYFEYYFGKYPSIIRKNRTSVAILNGTETERDYLSLGEDIFQYYGLGCRNVSKIFLKEEEQLQELLNAIEVYQPVVSHHKYLNNYDYNKSIYLVNREKHLDNGFMLLRQSKELVSPISVIYYELYTDIASLHQRLESQRDKIQCIVSKEAWYKGSVPFGKAQFPKVDDYADHVDTVQFLLGLNQQS